MSETAQAGGHIPGAQSIPWAQASRKTAFKSADDLKVLYQGKGGPPEQGNDRLLPHR